MIVEICGVVLERTHGCGVIGNGISGSAEGLSRQSGLDSEVLKIEDGEFPERWFDV